MSDKYYIIRVQHVQKVCYIVLGDVLGFKVPKAVDEIKSYFGKNNVDISTSWFAVSLNMYQIWLRLIIAEDLIDMNTGKDSVFDVMEMKSYATSVKYELEIEPHASIRSYTCNIPEIAKNLFNEWFNDDKTDEQNEKETVTTNPEFMDCEKRIDDVLSGDTKPLEDFIADHHFTNSMESNEEISDISVSSALSKIRIRIQDLERLKNSRSTIERDIIIHQKEIDRLTYQLNEIDEDIIHTQKRIDIIRKDAIEEGYDEWFIDRSLKEMGYKK